VAEAEIPTELKHSLNTITAHFAREAKRVGDPLIARAAHDLLLFYFTSLKQLGTHQYETAVLAINEQLRIAELHARTSYRSLWSRFWSAAKRRSPKPDQVFRDAIENAKKLLENENDFDPKITPNVKALIESATEAIEFQKRDDVLQREFENTLLSFDARMHWSTYTRLRLQRSISFIGKHSFTIGVPVLLGGIGYSFLVKQSQNLFARAFRLSSYGVLVLLFVTQLFKEYFVAKWIRKLRLKVERWLLIPVIHCCLN
jgi:hypothetical protein